MSSVFLIPYSLKATVILVAALGLCSILRRASAAARHLVWTTAFAALLLLPVLSRITPGWTAPVRASSVPRIASPSLTRAAPPPSASQPANPPIDWILRAWLLGATLVLARFGVGTGLVWLRTRQAHPMPILAPMGRIRVLDAGCGVMPMTWGAFRPVILLPSEAAAWPAERLRAVLLHEMAHVARHDWPTLAMAELAVALYWFHPLSWWAASRMRRERERACDDHVLAAGVAASGYAADLLEVARRLGGANDSLLPAPAMARASNLDSRLRAILDPKIRRVVNAKVAAIASAAAMLALLPLASLRLAGQAGGLTGSIYDFSGGVVPEAEVTVVNVDTGFSQTLSSGPAGAYAFQDLSAGRYQVKVKRPGFAVYLRESVAVPAVLDVVLSLGQVSESITVSGRRTQQAAAVPGPRRIRVGGNVQAARQLAGPRPVYPPRAESAGIQGTVLLHAVITIEGATSGLTVLSSPDPELTAAAMEAVRQWRYQPTLLNGQPVEIITTISVSFRLDQ